MWQGLGDVGLLTVVTIAALAAVILAIAAARAWRGAKIDDHLHCRRCNYDLFALPAESSRCPECGAELKARRATIAGTRRPRRLLSASLLLALLFTGVVATTATRTFVSRFDPYRWKPASWLKRDLTSPVPGVSASAERELQRRRCAGKLSDSIRRELTLLAPMPLGTVPLPKRPWDPRPYLPTVCVDCAVELRRAGKLSDADWDATCRNIIFCRINTKSPVRTGDPIAVRPFCVWTGDPSTGDTIEVGFTSVSVAVDGKPAELPKISWYQRSYNQHGSGGGSHEGLVWLNPDRWKELGEGRHSLVTVVDAAVKIHGPTFNPATEWHGQVHVNSDFDVVSAQTATVTTKVDSSLRDQVRTFLTPLDTVPHPACAVWFRQDGYRVPIDLSFDVYLRCDGKEYFAESFTTPATWPTNWGLQRVPDACDGKVVDLILRPSVAEAARHFDVHQIWGEEVVFPQVKLTPLPEWQRHQPRN